MKRLILEYLKLLLEEGEVDSESLLKKWASKTKDPNEQLLLKYNIVPIQRGDKDTSFLGEGVYSSAYEVLYDNKRRVAKITKSKQDISVLNTFNFISNHVPKEVAQHFLNVFDIIQDKESGYYIAIVEYLQPLDSTTRSEFWGYYSGNIEKSMKYMPDKWKALTSDTNLNDLISKGLKETIQKLNIKNKDTFFNALFSLKEWKGLLQAFKDQLDVQINNAKEILNDYLEIKSKQKPLQLKQYRNQISDEEEDELNSLNEKLNDIGNPFQHVNRTQSYVYRNNQQLIEELYNNFVQLIANKGWQEKLDKRQFDKLVLKIFDNIVDYLVGRIFPKGHDDQYEKELVKGTQNKQIASIMNALNYLKKKNIKWADLHDENLMQRNDGTIVISDPGLFEFGSKKKEASKTATEKETKKSDSQNNQIQTKNDKTQSPSANDEKTVDVNNKKTKKFNTQINDIQSKIAPTKKD